MTPNTTILILVACTYVPLSAIIAAIMVWSWRTRRAAGNPLVREGLLRPPGESLRIKIDDLSGRLGSTFATAVILPGVAMAGTLLSGRGGTVTTGSAWAALAVCTVVLLPLAGILFKRAQQLRDYQLGFRGERATGEQLNQLLRDGCHVFHDVSIAPYGNVDHVIVSPRGVFAVETKAHRKRKTPKNRPNWEVRYDGTTLEFPTYRNQSNLDDARRGAELLAKKLSKALGESIRVSPVLALPGWSVKSFARSPEIPVLNPKNIRFTVLSERGNPLPAQTINRITHVLEEECRDVDL